MSSRCEVDGAMGRGHADRLQCFHRGDRSERSIQARDSGSWRVARSAMPISLGSACSGYSVTTPCAPSQRSTPLIALRISVLPITASRTIDGYSCSHRHRPGTAELTKGSEMAMGDGVDSIPAQVPSCSAHCQAPLRAGHSGARFYVLTAKRIRLFDERTFGGRYVLTLKL